MREQNWFAVVLEFVIVVAGVLLAFQISAWRSEQEDGAYARDILERLHAELVTLETIRGQIRPRLTAQIDDLENVRPLIMGVSDRTRLTANECDRIGRSHETSAPPDQLPTLDELLNSGSLRVIESDTLRRSASSLDAMITMGRSYWQAVSALFDNLPETHPASVEPQLVAADTEPETEEWVLAFRCDLGAMQSSGRFKAAFNENLAVLTETRQWNYLAIDNMIEALHAAVDAELGLSHDASPGETAP